MLVDAPEKPPNKLAISPKLVDAAAEEPDELDEPVEEEPVELFVELLELPLFVD